MSKCLFVSDLHGNIEKYKKLFAYISETFPSAVFLGGDLLPSGIASLSSESAGRTEFLDHFLPSELSSLKILLKNNYPRVFAILGNDDARIEESSVTKIADSGLLEYVHFKKLKFDNYDIYGYSFVPPTPFLLKDWEKYDVSRYVDPGSISPEEGIRSIEASIHEKRYATIEEDLKNLAKFDDLGHSIFLFHSPPYDTVLDRAALDGKMIDFVPLDIHVGSIAIKKFIETRQPLITLHGHVHESTSLTGQWRQQLGRTWSFNAAHSGKDLSVIIFDPENALSAERLLI